MVLMTSAFAVLGFMAQTKLDERMGGPQEVRTTPAPCRDLWVCACSWPAPRLQKQRLHNLALKNIRSAELRQLNDESRADPCKRPS